MGYKKLKIAILSTDTLHHRYFINSVISSKIGIKKIIFEKTSIKSKFKDIDFYRKEENNYEKKNFFKNVSSKLNKDKIKYFTNINSNKSLKFFSKKKFDLGIVFGTRKINLDLINTFKLGLINIHRGIIHKYRGLESDLWAIYFKDFDNIGTSINFIDKNLDTGIFFKIKKFKIKKNMKIFHLRYYTTIIATKMVIDILKQKSFFLKKALKQTKIGKYYSFMPNYKKIKARANFKNYVETL